MANADHLERLRQGVDAWNAWRAKEPLVMPDLTKADFFGTDLTCHQYPDCPRLHPGRWWRER